MTERDRAAYQRLIRHARETDQAEDELTCLNVLYDTKHGTMKYCHQDMGPRQARVMLAMFRSKYLNPDGTPRAYPDGSGRYDVANPRIGSVL